MNNSEQLPNSQSAEQYESAEVLHSRMLEISAVLFEEKAGFISDEIIEVLEKRIDETHIFTNKKQAAEFTIDSALEKFAGEEDIDLKELNEIIFWFMRTFAILIIQSFTILSQGFTINKIDEKKDTIEIFVKEGNRKIFIHEISHYVENIIYDLVEIGVLTENDLVKDFIEERKGRDQKRGAETVRKSIAFYGVLASSIGIVLLTTKEALFGSELFNSLPKNLFLMITGTVYLYVFLNTLNSYEQSGEERRANQLMKTSDRFFKD